MLSQTLVGTCHLSLVILLIALLSMSQVMEFIKLMLPCESVILLNVVVLFLGYTATQDQDLQIFQNSEPLTTLPEEQAAVRGLLMVAVL